MITIKIISNPYKKQIRFQKLSEDGSEWKNIDFCTTRIAGCSVVRSQNIC